MNAAESKFDWTAFLGRPVVGCEPAVARAAVAGQTVLITGAGGSIGSGLARAALAGGPRRLVLLDVAEAALYECHRRLLRLAEPGCEIVPVTGSVIDERALGHLLRRWRPEVIFHAAAYKHVPLMERNPLSALANNAIGTYRLAVAALEAGVLRVIAVSTDKAVHPKSVMGASKRIAEQVVLSLGAGATRMNAVRLCNVLGSSGSVVPIFAEQAKLGLPLTVTDAGAERYFLAPEEAEAAILRSACSPAAGRVLLPDCGKAFSILSLARFVGEGSGADVKMELVGLRPGDKLREELLSSEEVVESGSEDGLRVVVSPAPSAMEMAGAIARLAATIEANEEREAMAVIGELVPGFVPGNKVIAAGVVEAR